MKTKPLLFCFALTLLLAGCARNLPTMTLQHTVAPNETQYENKGNLVKVTVFDQRELQERTITKYKDTVILSGVTSPPTVDFVKTTIEQEIAASGLLTLDESAKTDVIFLKNGSMIKGNITETEFEGAAIKTLKITNDLGTTSYLGNEVDRVEQSNADPYELNVTLKSANVLKKYSSANWCVLIPTIPIAAVAGWTGNIALHLVWIGISGLGSAIIPDSYIATTILDITLKKNGLIVSQEEIVANSQTKQSQYGSLANKVQKGSVMFDQNLTTAIRDMIARISSKI